MISEQSHVRGQRKCVFIPSPRELPLTPQRRFWRGMEYFGRSESQQLGDDLDAAMQPRIDVANLDGDD